MSEWKKVKFRDLFSEPTKNGIYKTKEFHGRGAKIINMGEIFAYSFVGSQEMNRVEINEKERDSFLVSDGDLLFARRSLIESGAGKCSIVSNISDETTFESSIIRVRLNKHLANPLFYMYWMRSLAGKTAMNGIVSGLNVKGIRASDLQNIDVDFPSLSIQNSIADILSRYDSLIENYQKQIKLLEEAAQRLYKEWFVDLHFPGHENTMIVDGVPEGWEKKMIGEIAEINKRNISKNYEYSYVNYTDLGNVRLGRMDTPIKYNYGEEPGRAKRIAIDGDIIWGMVRPNLKSYALVQYPKEQDVFSTGFAVLTAKRVPFSFLYCSVTTDAFVGYLVNCTNGAAYPAVKPEHFSNAELIIPSKNTLDMFNSLVEPMFRRIGGLQSQIRLLTEARDRLLPKLMSGEIAV